MEAYSGFASVYDLFMEDIPYQDWCEYLCGLLKRAGIEEGLVLELGCGTGTLTELLAGRGYDMIGLDRSEEMLEIAMRKKELSGVDILYLLQDMREFELYGTVRAVVSLCDSMNYLLEESELEQVFGLVNNYLDPGGLFIFDLKTDYFYKNCTGDQIFGENRENNSFIWENYYYEEECVNEYALTIFSKVENGLYQKSEETHYQRAYPLETVKGLLEKAGMEFVTAYDSFTDQAPKDDSSRIYVIAKEHGKDNQ